MLEAAIERGLGEFTLKDIADGLINGDFLLWVAVKPGRIFGCAVTTIEEFPQAKHLLVMLGGGPGEGREVVNALWPVIEEYARLEGCTYVRFHGRRGWARSGMLPPGWRHTHDVIGVPVR